MKKRQYLKYITMMFAGCVLLCRNITGCGIRDSALVIPLEESEPNAGEAEETKELIKAQEVICVYVCGAVVAPGVYEIPEESRVIDALQAAGGFAQDAGLEAVNLAARVKDGEQLYFPTEAEAEESRQAGEAEANGLVNINTADLSRLMTLPGIGESRAQDIIAYREKYGEFEEKEDLKKVPGIKENMYAKLCDKIVVQ